MIEPVCPYCGRKMEPKEVFSPSYALARYACECANCGARGPIICGVGAMVALKEKAVIRALKYSREEVDTSDGSGH